MSQREIFEGPVCGIDNCTATRYFEDEDGTSCVRGHEHRELQRRDYENEDYIQASNNTSARRQKEKPGKVVEKLDKNKQYELFLQCYQLVLWKQASWLVNTKRLPKELEVVIRDLWSIRLQKLAARVTLDEEDGEASQRSQFYSISEDSNNESEDESSRSTTAFSFAKRPRLIETLALCYMGIMLLRLPISPGDLHRWAACGQMPYNDALAELPEAMRQPLDHDFLQCFEPVTLIRTGQIQHAIVIMAVAYHRVFHMKFPPINLPLLLYRYIKHLALPLEIYPCVRSLAGLAGLNFSYPPISQKGWLSLVPDAQILSLIIVSAKLLFPISKPRIYPATSTEPASLAMNWKTWLSAKQAHDARFSLSGRLGYTDAYAAKDADVFNWKESQMDDYMEWYGRMWTRAEPPDDSDLRKALYDLFPVDTDSSRARPEGLNEDLTANDEAMEASRCERIRVVQSTRKQIRVISEEHAERRTAAGKRTARPGEVYERFERVEDLDGPKGGDGAMRALHEEAAEIAGLSLKTMVLAVRRIERRLTGWVQSREAEERKKARENRV